MTAAPLISAAERGWTTSTTVIQQQLVNAALKKNKQISEEKTIRQCFGNKKVRQKNINQIETKNRTITNSRQLPWPNMAKTIPVLLLFLQDCFSCTLAESCLVFSARRENN